MVDERVVTDSGGHRGLRPFTLTRLELAGVVRDIEVNLTDRRRMRFPMTAWLLVLLAFGAHAAEPDRRIAITIDDLPWQRMDKTPAADLPLRHAQLMAQLKQAGVPVVGFVNEGKLEIDGQV